MPYSGPGIQWGTKRGTTMFHIGYDRECLGHIAFCGVGYDFYLNLIKLSWKGSFIHSFLLFSFFLFSFFLFLDPFSSEQLQWRRFSITKDPITWWMSEENNSLVSIENVFRVVISKPFLVLPWRKALSKKHLAFSHLSVLSIQLLSPCIRERTETTLCFSWRYLSKVSSSQLAFDLSFVVGCRKLYIQEHLVLKAFWIS